ncbi:MAG: exodeoxyribonuclease VII large subunit [Chloroflexi bacterium]|nr:exodeoxyribonuclease VII large subunit [Chloroflexota bacterium]
MIDSFSVAELTTHIRELIESSQTLQDVWVSGEISNFSKASSGHWYFTLKDSKAQLKCVMWRSAASQQMFPPNNGEAVLAHGYIGVYDGRGEYQLYADKLRPVGIGDLYAQFERLKQKLEAEGLFAPERKRPLPPFPRIIGVVTSADAAALQDVQNVLRRRFPLAEVLLSATPVQGADAATRIVKAIERLQETPADVLLLCRGGGSIEDLWAFNDESVARAIAASRIPVVSGVGHETDFTIADFAADLRAPTPSAAAEIATPDSADLRDAVARAQTRLGESLRAAIGQKRAALNNQAWALKQHSPQNTIRGQRQRIDDLNARLLSGQRARLTLLRTRLAGRLTTLNASSPRALLARGYALVSKSLDGARVTRAADAKPGEGLTLQFHDGELKVRVEDKDTHERYPRKLF